MYIGTRKLIGITKYLLFGGILQFSLVCNSVVNAEETPRSIPDYPERVAVCVSLDDQTGLIITQNEATEIFTWMIAIPVTPPGGSPKSPAAWKSVKTRHEGRICRFDTASGLVFFGGQFPIDPNRTAEEYLTHFRAFDSEIGSLDNYFALPKNEQRPKIYLFDSSLSVINSAGFGSAMRELTGGYTEKLNYTRKGALVVSPPFFDSYRLKNVLDNTSKAGAIQRRGTLHRPALAFSLSSYGDPLETAGRLGAAYLSAALSKYYIIDLQESESGARLLVSERRGGPDVRDRAELKDWARLAERDLRRKAKRGADRADVITLRERRLLERAIRRDKPVEHLAHLARRLRFVSPETMLAEEQAFALLDVSTVNAALDRLAKSPAPQLWLPSGGVSPFELKSSLFVNLREISGEPVVKESENHSLQRSRLFWEPGEQEAVAITIFAPLPSKLPKRRHLNRIQFFNPGSWLGKIVFQPPAPVREEAAQVWNAKYAQTLNKHPNTTGIISVRLPSILPGVFPDPTGSNQFSAVVLETKSENIELLLKFTNSLLEEEAKRKTISKLRESFINFQKDDVNRLYMKSWNRQMSLVLETDGATILEARKKAFDKTLSSEAPKQWIIDLWEEAMFSGGVIVAIVGPSQVSDNQTVRLILDQFSTTLRNLHIEDLPEKDSRWSIPPDAQRNWSEKLYWDSWGALKPKSRDTRGAAFVSLEAEPERHAAMLVLAEAWREFQKRNNNPIYQADVTLLDFPGRIGWYMELGRLGGGQLTQWHTNLLKGGTLLTSGLDGDFEAEVERLWVQRRTHASQAGNLSFLRARDIHLYDDPLWRDKVDAALLNLTPEKLRQYADELAAKLEALTTQ